MPQIIGASVYSEVHPGSHITDEEWAFLKAMETYQRKWRRRYPSYREMLYVLHCCGYRKVAPAVPADTRPITQAELRLADAIRAKVAEQEAASPQLPV
ncbi:MAG: hypothetical protein U0791_23925 [Gemmataceae bacterium]